MKKPITVLMFLAFFFVNAQNDASCTCCSENHMAFDFWVGNWEVTNANGTPAGTSKISKEEGNCTIRENWTSASSGFTGTSLNFFNTTTKQWEQLWIDNAGTFLKLKGNRVGNQMILSSDEFKQDDGKLYKNRITWTKNEDGTVRQLWEVLQGEKVTNTAFDGLYKKK
ncbi:hypothetical protein FVB32_10510 [Flagellimonas hymeniacidonis]|uniref:Lipocalin-like domain-containing protein n=1 Tax=Flagellimonas hymeniacidonis TaxID=2603628 RepID=A0A5C8V082_9FLAO|nr:hypothetical protein [Flagellimonas hymeniacidonis]TXN35020.1 hypothetical protein FVB32_10510 [Flagellimonas hymeniacidonis]